MIALLYGCTEPDIAVCFDALRFDSRSPLRLEAALLHQEHQAAALQDLCRTTPGLRFCWRSIGLSSVDDLEPTATRLGHFEAQVLGVGVHAAPDQGAALAIIQAPGQGVGPAGPVRLPEFGAMPLANQVAWLIEAG